MTAPPLNYTTTIKATRTIGECQELLAQAGASAVGISYVEGRPAGLSFALPTVHGSRGFQLPVDVAAIARLLAIATYPASVKGVALAKYKTMPHAGNVAWRIIKDWLEAQLALVAASMVTMDQVMLPYLVVDDDQHTLYDAYQLSELKAIEA